MTGAEYVLQVDDALARLRIRCLGQDTPFGAILPRGGNGMSNEQKADYLADVLLFAVLRSAGSFPQDTRRIRECLRTSALYLLESCRTEDQTFEELRKLMDLSEGIRKLLFEEERYHLMHGAIPQDLCSRLDVALVEIFQIQKVCNERRKKLLELENQFLKTPL